MTKERKEVICDILNDYYFKSDPVVGIGISESINYLFAEDVTEEEMLEIGLFTQEQIDQANKDNMSAPEQFELDEECEDKMVSHPPHYQSASGLEVIDAIDAFVEGLEGKEAVYTGNVLKYVCRWKKKNGIQDLNKAKWYLERLIKTVEKETTENE